ncbi:MAG: urate hydroxylase PuuD [Acidobacteriota bacterium]|nr:urate hydroxylase PuuD [Acidobacteriota bacterium]
MLIESNVQLPIILAMLQDLMKVFKSPSASELAHILVRWLHFVGGITWIGLLYFFNLVNVPLQKGLDADTKKKVNPELLGRALWYFRWGAVLTVLAGLMYYAMWTLAADVNANNSAGGTANVWVILLVWLLCPIVVFVIEFLIIKKVPALTKDGRVFAIVVLILVIAMSVAVLCWLTKSLPPLGASFASNKTLSIGVGGALGIIMLLNVWGIIWPNNKRGLAALAGGPPAAPELPRQAFLASRTNAWLSLPLLLLMGTAHGDWIIFGGA